MPKSYETIEFKSEVLKKMGPFKIIPKHGTTENSRAPVNNATKKNSSSESKPPSYESLYPKLQ